jgi:DNA-binding PadR family transcriptional regulator
VFHILLAVAGEERHGYAIMRETEEASGGRVKLGPGTLYGAIKRLFEHGLLEEVDERPDPDLDDQRRRYYRATPFGAKVLKAELQRFSDLLRAAEAKRLLGGT